MNAFTAYVLTAAAGGLASIAVALTAIKHLSFISDSAMWSIAVMVAAPAAMAVGVAYFINQ